MTREELSALMARARTASMPASAPARAAPPADAALDAVGVLVDTLDRLRAENRLLRQRLGIPEGADLWTDALPSPPAPGPALAADPLLDLDRVLSGLGKIHGVDSQALHPTPHNPRTALRANGHRRKDK